MINKLIPQIKQTKEKIHSLNEKIKQMAEHESHFLSNQDESQYNEINRTYHLIFGGFQDSIEAVQQMVNVLKVLRDEFNTSPSDELQLPTTEKIKQMLRSFFKGSIKTKASPLPLYCGCYAYKLKDLKEGNFICARIISSDNKPHYYLYIVAKYANDICEAYDPEKADTEMKLISLKEGEWTPLPTVIPERPLKRWEHSKDSEVLSLFQEDDEWTTEFYPAKVLVIPWQRQNEDIRGYELEFEGSSSKHIVPENFIVQYSKMWKEADKKLAEMSQ
ncbi:hypothetical protein M9Y10_034463 [Tritrichomonas musculus]|uniref:SGF29 C-terminal domain-containing protein n=1 Tax=Tritrichomonas musculus TaxID=1915356 RepID=A0ABR2KEZ7_9EUKA